MAEILFGALLMVASAAVSAGVSLSLSNGREAPRERREEKREERASRLRLLRQYENMLRYDGSGKNQKELD